MRCVFRRDYGSLTIDVPPSETTRWRAVVRVLRSPLDAVSCALLPACCALCGSPLPQLSPVPICNACWSEFPLSKGPICHQCGDSVEADQVRTSNASSTLCRACRMAPPPFVRAVSFAPYQGRMKDAIHALKYDRLHPAADRLGQKLAIAIGQLAGEAPSEMLVVPVPLHRSKYSDRGFNQASLLATSAMKALGKSHPQWRLTLAANMLMRVRATTSQAGLTPRMRRLNVRSAFAVSDPAAVAGKDVLLVDDILTTGATARAAAAALAKAGAASIWVATLARARRMTDSGARVSFEDQDSDKTAGNSPEDISQISVTTPSANLSSHDQSMGARDVAW